MNKLNSTETTFRELLVQIQQTRQKVFTQANTSLRDCIGTLAIPSAKKFSAKPGVRAWYPNWHTTSHNTHQRSKVLAIKISGA